MYNIVVWAITGAYFNSDAFYILSVFWGSFSCAVLQTLVWVSGAQEGQVWCVMGKDAHTWTAGSPRCEWQP